jgi:hypothetical protein
MISEITISFSNVCFNFTYLYHIKKLLTRGNKSQIRLQVSDVVE